MRAPVEVVRLLEFKTDGSAAQIRRILLLSGESAVLEEIWLPGVSPKGLTAERLTEWKGPMYVPLKVGLGMCMLRATERIRTVVTDPTTVESLSVAAESPSLSVERVSRTSGDKPVEICYGLYVTARCHYQNESN